MAKISKKRLAKGYSHLCRAPRAPKRILDPSITTRRAQAILSQDGKWATNTPLKYYFYTSREMAMPLYGDDQRQPTDVSGADGDVEAVRTAFAEWKSVGIGLDFIEVSTREDAEIRIGFWHDDPFGSWSWLGRTDHRRRENRIPARPTMNFAWDLTGAGYDTALHEIGHAIGLVHAHKNPESPLVWNETEIYEIFRALGWSDDSIRFNVLEKASPNEVEGSEWNSNSIMQYHFEYNVIDAPPPYNTQGVHPAGGLSNTDKAWIKHFYPEQDPSDLRNLQSGASQFLNVLPGKQANFIFEPDLSKSYHCQMMGDADCVVVIFEDLDDGYPEFRAGDDDSGAEQNVNFEYRFLRGHRYIIRIMLNYLLSDREPAFVVY